MRKVVKKTNVILVQKIKNLGNIGDIVAVKVGYAKNYLLPQSIALRATKANIEYYNQRKEYYAELNKQQRIAAEAEAKQLRGYELTILRTASENGSLYGSVSRKDISEELLKNGFKVSTQKIELRHPIKEVGYSELEIHVHPDVVAVIFVNVAKTKDDAIAQSKAYMKQQQELKKAESESQKKNDQEKKADADSDAKSENN